MGNESSKTSIEDLFVSPKDASFYNYVLVLVRPKGVSRFADPLWVAYSQFLRSEKFKLTEDLLIETLSLVFNLSEHKANREYHPFPFGKSLSEGKRVTVALLKKNGQETLAQVIEENFPEEATYGLEASAPLSDFLQELTNRYFQARLDFNKTPGRLLYKMPHFEVFEVLKDDTYGLYGFNMYFSNGSHANYERTGERTTGINVLTDYPINYNVGLIDDLKREWKVGTQRAYEVGISGRYNDWGEWMPLVYPGDNHQMFLTESERIAGDDHQVAGILFYIMCTGHRIIEFAVKTPIELPNKYFSLGSRMHMYKCEPLDQTSHSARDFHIYDGHYELDDLDPKTIRNAIASINVGLNRMAFSYDSSVDWCIKYSIYKEGGHSKPTPTNEQLDVLNSMLVDFPDTEDAIVLDICIDWFHRGELARRKNVFLAFLSYYIALESVATAIADGDADLGLGYVKETKAERKTRVVSEIQKLHDELYNSDPQKFIERAYFEQVVGLKAKTRKVMELVFGTDHAYVKTLFEKVDGKESIYDLRGELAHGGITLLDSSHQKRIRERLPELAEIVREFVRKIIVKPGQELPRWTGGSTFSVFPSDPRDMMISSDMRMYERLDWKIKPEWFD
ncbi:MAG: hypothetical protein NTZ13_02190 [Candidatus Parcubacteria bacterium]|nr:hypothetical protein [Candidatus Parcubacteria bacterium]